MPEVIWHLLENPDGTGFLQRANQKLTSPSYGILELAAQMIFRKLRVRTAECITTTPYCL